MSLFFSITCRLSTLSLSFCCPPLINQRLHNNFRFSSIFVLTKATKPNLLLAFWRQSGQKWRWFSWVIFILISILSLFQSCLHFPPESNLFSHSTNQCNHFKTPNTRNQLGFGHACRTIKWIGNLPPTVTTATWSTAAKQSPAAGGFGRVQGDDAQQ